MKTFRFAFAFLALVLAALSVTPAIAQTNTLSATTLSAAMDATQGYALVVSASGIAANKAILIDGELMNVSALYNGTATNVPVARNGGKKGPHISGAVVLAGRPNWFYTVDPVPSACTLSSTFVAPWVNVTTGSSFRCYDGLWGKVGVFFVPPWQCTFLPTTLTQTTTQPVLGVGATVGVPVINSVTNAAAGTDTISCFIIAPADVGSGRSSLVTDLTFTLGSQTVAPTSLGTPLLGSITFPVLVATTQTMSSQTIVSTGTTITQLGPTTSLTTVTTAGDFLTFNYSFSPPIDLATDLKALVFQLPILQSAASAMTINSAGLFVHYLKRQ